MSARLDTSTHPLTVRRGLDSVRITWSDEHDSTYPNGYLRDNCPCAACREHGPRYHLPLVDREAPHPTQITAVGRYALGISWSDGHDAGIYSYETLRALCPCDGCARPLPR